MRDTRCISITESASASADLHSELRGLLSELLQLLVELCDEGEQRIRVRSPSACATGCGSFFTLE